MADESTNFRVHDEIPSHAAGHWDGVATRQQLKSKIDKIVAAMVKGGSKSSTAIRRKHAWCASVFEAVSQLISAEPLNMLGGSYNNNELVAKTAVAYCSIGVRPKSSGVRLIRPDGSTISVPGAGCSPETIQRYLTNVRHAHNVEIRNVLSQWQATEADDAIRRGSLLLPFAVYRRLAVRCLELAVESADLTHLYMHTYLVLGWTGLFNHDELATLKFKDFSLGDFQGQATPVSLRCRHLTIRRDDRQDSVCPVAAITALLSALWIETPRVLDERFFPEALTPHFCNSYFKDRLAEAKFRQFFGSWTVHTLKISSVTFATRFHPVHLVAYAAGLSNVLEMKAFWKGPDVDRTSDLDAALDPPFLLPLRAPPRSIGFGTQMHL